MLEDNKHQQPSAAILVIGDEILSGRTRDLNSHFVSKKLTEIGIKLSEIRVVPDSKSEIVSSINFVRAKYRYIFTSEDSDSYKQIWSGGHKLEFTYRIKILDFEVQLYIIEIYVIIAKTFIVLNY